MRPVVGFTTRHRTVTSEAGAEPVYTAGEDYARMIRAAGGLPVALLAGDDSEADEILDRIDALVLSGGGDVDPAYYGSPGDDTVYGVDPPRDRLEVALAQGARERRLPTLCICRGMQVLNVALGGSLIVHLDPDGDGAFDHRNLGTERSSRHHSVILEPGSLTAKALGVDAVEVNSFHHQAVDRIAPGLVVTGRAPDGVVEALAPEDDAWPMWAVQWHPEALGPRDEPSLRLFRSLVEAANEATRLQSLPPEGEGTGGTG